ncbi:multifunctional CCA addition/repair protein [Aliiglaciecola sp. 2_MG-2023]|uniref:multifunctional CCA addition/repair protein n=1 Tax=unclassified Aliiglaciecola TaxID=2593648 RepID=UPI0026E2B08A|nr:MULTISPECIES: multifunctional CCA addition/repair protein [unclassified Aliiglaciecola]MDO6711525.1 multifunctional CCA addition/repair protein [Aliiglaciecola sp. 2_MG-2023]MDO6752499.1 multifunctional CCA addition/repair protein [Aliiglaciecola sp. 1_MG-2023]
MNCFLVGGAVRDKLLDRKVSDRDWVVVGETVDSMLAAGYEQVGSDFPVFLHPKTKEEYALARTERKSGKGYTGFEVNSERSITLEEDLKRRDLTINAMALDKNQQLIDPFNGQNDLHNRLLRHVSPAFVEDPLRVLRVARFAARYHQYGFEIAPETASLMKQMVDQGELDHLVPERVWKETSRALLEKDPDIFFEVLRACGALKVWFPELDVLWGIPNPVQWHPEVDTGIHTMMVIQQAAKLSDNLAIRYAALVHDLGKGLTDPAQWPSHREHEELGVAPIRALSERLKVPNECKELAIMTSEYHTHIHRALELRPATILKVLNHCDAWRKPERFNNLLTTCIADAKGRTGLEDRDYPQAEFIWNAYQAAMKVEVKSIIEAGATGKNIKLRLDEKRINAIREFKQAYQPD